MKKNSKLQAPSGNYLLDRLPKITTGDLRAWDAADELLIHTISDQMKATRHSIRKSNPILVINDSFGALPLAFHEYQIHSWSDSFLSHQACKNNFELNHMEDTCLYIPSTQELTQTYDWVIIKIPKTLSLLEDQLLRLKPYLSNTSKVIAGAMSKHIHNSTLKLFERIIGTTTTSRATKKARLIFSEVNQALPTLQSPYPTKTRDEDLQLSLLNYANVFSKDKLDIGTRFLIAQLEHCPKSKLIIDLGCGNGALGIMAKRLQSDAQICFIDESYSAIHSATENYLKENPIAEQKNKQGIPAVFLISDCLSQYNSAKPGLILCNPPFHQAHSIGDHIAWQMFKQSHLHLEKDGQLWVISNRHLGYHIKLKKLFGNCSILASNNKFVVLTAKKTKN